MDFPMTDREKAGKESECGKECVWNAKVSSVECDREDKSFGQSLKNYFVLLKMENEFKMQIPTLTLTRLARSTNELA